MKEKQKQSCQNKCEKHCEQAEDKKDCSCQHEDGQCCCNQDKANEYLEMAKRLQAEFENYRKRTFFEIKKAKEDGEIGVMEAFLPCLDTFKVAKQSITDEKVLQGVEMIEHNILQALEKLGVQKIQSVGQNYDPNLHNAIAVMCDEKKPNDIILDEYQAGYKYNDRVIRYSKVIVNKKED